MALYFLVKTMLTVSKKATYFFLRGLGALLRFSRCCRLTRRLFCGFLVLRSHSGPGKTQYVFWGEDETFLGGLDGLGRTTKVLDSFVVDPQSRKIHKSTVHGFSAWTFHSPPRRRLFPALSATSPAPRTAGCPATTILSTASLRQHRKAKTSTNTRKNLMLK